MNNNQNTKRFYSLSEIENYHQKSEIRIPLFDKESADFCFEKSCEILSKPFNLESGGNNAALNEKKSRDFIGQNLLDIENTLKALNLDFLQAFNELEKTDSSETLFGEAYSYDSAGINPKLRSSALRLTKLSQHYKLANKLDFSPKLWKNNNQFSPSDKTPQPHSAGVSGHFFTNCSEKFDDKRSSTPDTGFASRETNSSSRRSSQKSSYSPQESHYSPKDCNLEIANRSITSLHCQEQRVFTSAQNKTVHSSINSIYSLMHSTPTPNRRYFELDCNRKRSMSFSENYDLKSPTLSEPHPNNVDSKILTRNKPRKSSVYKPRSVRARNLRRLSYNPIILDSSSSSSCDTDLEKNMAHSECDIRSTVSKSSRRRRHYLNRKTINTVSNQDKLYGSNASIKSAPQYNYSNDRIVHKYLDQQINYRNYGCDKGINGYGVVDDGRGRICITGSGSGGGVGSVSSGSGSIATNVIHQPRGFLSEATSVNYNRNILYSEFDVTKLTGKSPTTQSFLSEIFPEQQSTKNTANPAKSNVFQWPDKIHASAVKQNDLLIRRQQENQIKNIVTVTTQQYSSNSSCSDTDPVGYPHCRENNYSGSIVPMPPSPAP